MAEDLSQEKLVKLVEVKPEIWDKTDPVYRDNNLKSSAWDFVCNGLKEDYSELNEEEKQAYGKLVRKKWTNMKDTWVKHNRRLKKQPNMTGRRYYFYDKMKFLAKVFDITDKATESDSTSESEEDNKAEVQRALRKRKASLDPLNVVVTETGEIDSSLHLPGVFDVSAVAGTMYDNSRSMSFFRSIAPSVDNFSEDNFIEFQYLVLSIVKQMKQSEKRGC